MASTAVRNKSRPSFMRENPRLGPELRFVTRDAAVSAPAEGSNTVGFRGHAVVYGEWTEIYDPWWGMCWQEQVAPGACAASMGADDVRFLLNHDANYLLARRRGDPNDTLRLTEDGVGLLCEADMDSRVSYVRDLAVALERGDISGMSFAFEVTDDEWDMRPDGMWLRTIRGVKLYDVSVVTYPAYAQTDAQLRSLMLRSAGGQVGAREGAAHEERQGRRNSSADEAILRSAIERLGTLAEQLQPLLEAEQAEGDNDDDVAILESSIELANDVAADLESLLEAEQAEPDEEDSSARALAANQATRHRGLAAKLGLTRAT